VTATILTAVFVILAGICKAIADTPSYSFKFSFFAASLIKTSNILAWLLSFLSASFRSSFRASSERAKDVLCFAIVLFICGNSVVTLRYKNSVIMEKEIWKDVIGFEGTYRISNQGRIMSVARIVKRSDGRLFQIKDSYLNPRVGKKGYWVVNLWADGKYKTKTIHLLLGKHFLENPHNKPTVNHIDGNKLNNSLSNLEWATYSEQISHAYATGLNIPPGTGKFSGDHPTSKKVVQKSRDGQIVKIWDSARDAYREGFSFKEISACCRGKKKTHKNFIWEFYAT
jgi:hypothetical protein